MNWINLIAISTLVVFMYLYMKYINHFNYLAQAVKPKMNQNAHILILLGAALTVRLILAYCFRGHETDINCFVGWSNSVVKNGITNFYAEPGFKDYPPGYMYVLYFIGGIREFFGIDPYSSLGIVFIKLPAIICDMVTGYIIYQLAIRKINERVSLICCGMYLLNPAILINSSYWGQVDSVYTLAVVLTIYFIVEKKLPIAYFAFAIGILIKPQTLIFTPVLIYAFIDEIFLSKEGFDLKNFLHNMIWGIIALVSMFACMLPFGFTTAFNKYLTTMTSYQHASVNAYNIWTMFGLNWVPQDGKFLFFTYSAWGSLFIVLIVVIATYISFKVKKDASKYFFLGAFIVISMFLLSVRMHERYMFPALALLMLTFVYKPRKKMFLLYILFSIAHFYNVSHALFFYDYQNFSSKAIIPIVISMGTVVVYLYLIYVVYKCFIKGEVDPELNNKDDRLKNPNSNIKVEKHIGQTDGRRGIMTSETKVKILKIDIIAMIVITVIYAAIALFDLGNREAPQSSWQASLKGESIILDLGEEKTVSKISYFLGNYENRLFSIETSTERNGSWTKVSDFTMTSVFAWGDAKDDAASTQVNTTSRYLRLTSNSEKSVVRELVLLDNSGNKITPVNQNEYKELFDEQDMYPTRSTFRDSTYFDEIYYARTGYEFIHGLYSYENTHPPLGKIFVAISMLIFGVNPFGWRIMGTLFGIAMVPIIYMFAKRFFKETWLATIVTLLFAFDFMHFTQTRLATIDVFVTFFIILMYYFMYQYSTLSFYDTPLKKTFIPLGLSGVFMGFGIACKWTGVYAGVGLAIIFFFTLFKRYKEFSYAKSKIKDSTNGIQHLFVASNYKNYAIKTILFCIVFFVVIPFTIYTLCYLPFVGAEGQGLLTRMLNNQTSMLSYHSHVTATHPYSSWWYQWPIMYRPIWYYSGQVSSTVSEGISAFGNPILWWVGIPAFIYMVYLSIKEKDKKATFLVIGYLAQYMPWFLVTRITFIYHYFPCTVFVAFMVVYSISKVVNRFPKMKKIAIAYTVLACILFIMFYPVLSGQPVNKHYVYTFLKWFDSWVLVV